MSDVDLIVHVLQDTLAYHRNEVMMGGRVYTSAADLMKAEKAALRLQEQENTKS